MPALHASPAPLELPENLACLASHARTTECAAAFGHVDRGARLTSTRRHGLPAKSSGFCLPVRLSPANPAFAGVNNMCAAPLPPPLSPPRSLVVVLLFLLLLGVGRRRRRGFLQTLRHVARHVIDLQRPQLGHEEVSGEGSGGCGMWRAREWRGDAGDPWPFIRRLPDGYMSAISVHRTHTGARPAPQGAGGTAGWRVRRPHLGQVRLHAVVATEDVEQAAHDVRRVP